MPIYSFEGSRNETGVKYPNVMVGAGILYLMRDVKSYKGRDYRGCGIYTGM